LPQLLQTTFQYTAMLSGLALMPGGFAMLLVMPIAGQISGRFQPKYLIAAGLGAIALAMWYTTNLVPDASFSFFSWTRVFQMIGLPFLFIPINTVAYDGLAPEKTNHASSLINVARNLGGSIGIALANTEIVQRTQFHQSRLVENFTPSSSALQTALHRLTEYFSQHGASAAAAKSQAMGILGQMVETQSTLLAYIDVFYVCAVFAALLIPLVLLMLRRVNLRPAH
jgi:DHA2 family multidrug resistance protein